MSPLAEFLHLLFAEGRVVLRDRPVRSGERPPDALELLATAFSTHRLQVAGPRIEWDPAAGLAAAHLVANACWFLVSHQEPPEELQRCLKMPGPPSTPGQHLSADLLLRYLPQVHRRARAVAPADPLALLLADVLRQWPLSGVLADVPDGPTTTPTFAGHPGLLLLYAERLAGNGHPAWAPADGPGRDYVELVAASERRRP
jgi:MoxR-vWA-beta-propeller ternary system domain bpX4